MYGVGFGYGSAGATTILKSGSTAFDTDAQAFFTAASITDLTQKNAVNQLVLDLKSSGYWSGIKALYPFIGGSATAHSYNLKNTSLYQMTWYSGVTHDSTGVTFNGTSGYGDTGIYPNSVLSLDSSLLSVKFASNFTSGFAIASTTGSRIEIYREFSDTYFAVNSGESYASMVSMAGIITLNRNNSTNQAIYKDGTLVSNASLSSTSLSTTKIFTGCRSISGDTPSGYCSNKQQLLVISNGVSDVSGLNTILQTYSTAIGR